MRPDPRLARLAALAAALRDAQLAQLSAAVAQRQATEAGLAALRPQADPDGAGTDPVLAARVALRHQAWAEERRIVLNRELARRQAAVLEAQRTATQAFGRAEALRRLTDRR